MASTRGCDKHRARIRCRRRDGRSVVPSNRAQRSPVAARIIAAGPE
jgi:hypothetical protein